MNGTIIKSKLFFLSFGIFISTLLIKCASNDSSIARDYYNIPIKETKGIKLIGEIIGQGNDESRNLLRVNLNLVNNQDTSFNFFLMTCSWDHSGIIDNDEFHFFAWGCDSNFPGFVSLNNKDTLILKTWISVPSGYIKHIGEKFRIGIVPVFNYEFEYDFFDLIKQEFECTNNIIWSNELTIQKTMKLSTVTPFERWEIKRYKP